MVERVGDDIIYCDVAEDVMGYAGQKNAAAGARSRRLLPKRPRYPVVPVDADDPFVKVCRIAAIGAEALLNGCTSCDRGLVRDGAIGSICLVQAPFEELRQDIQAQLDNLSALRNEQ